MSGNYVPGQGCQCHAHSEAECGCDVDWTPREVYELREQRDRLAEALREIAEGSPCLECGGGYAMWLAEKALSAVKGGSDE
jgi:hypothetical protein